jgi:hypothetical protein
MLEGIAEDKVHAVMMYNARIEALPLYFAQTIQPCGNVPDVVLKQ